MSAAPGRSPRIPETPEKRTSTEDDFLPTIAAGEGATVPLTLGGVNTDCFAEQADWDGDEYPANEPGVCDLGNRHFVAAYGEAGYRWWHDCTAVEHVSWGWFGRVSATEASGHRVVSYLPLTVEGSLLCTKCGDHGFIRETKWVPA